MDANYTVKLNPYDQNKLSALIQLDNTEAVKFDYTVQGKTSNADFYYSTDEYTTNTQIIVAGLYADYLNTITLNIYTADNETTTFSVTISTEGQDYGNVPLELTINIEQRDGGKDLRAWVVCHQRMERL
ncbi:TPA: aryl-sulfate sulfotransferase N-terminal domain-containing protein [Citrobacter werkmanii]